MEVKHDASPFMGVMMRVGSVYRIKIRRREVLQGPKVASAIMVARWTADAVMILGKGKQTSLGSKQKIWTSNTALGTFTGITMRVRSVHLIKIRNREALQGPKVASAIMVARWTADAVMVLDKGKQTSLG